MNNFTDGMVEQTKFVGKYGVTYLDEYLLGIKQSDFVMIGASTGVGKSGLAYQIAFNNAEKLNVHLFALEADKDEPYRRVLYKQYSNELKKQGIYADYRRFIVGDFENPILVSKIDKELVEKYHKLEIHYRDKEFTRDTLIAKLQEICDFGKCDMLILDHVDYFDMVDGVSENLQVTDIMKLLRDVNLKWNIPVILISHLRKKSNRKSKIPDIDDLFGTSNKPKQMKTIILIAQDYENSVPELGKYSTFFIIAKDRLIGASHFIGQCLFDTNTNTYDDRYTLYKSKNYGEDVEIYEGIKPRWSVFAN